MEKKRKIEVCLSTGLFEYYDCSGAVVVVVDILRATTAICTAFKNGAESLIPVATLEEANEYKENGFLVAAEREGVKPGFADFGNSPFNFIPEQVEGETIAYSTTNGTQAINMAKKASKVVIGSFLNLSAISGWLTSENLPVTVLCAGRKGRFCLEDAVFAGALCSNLMRSGNFYSRCDSLFAATGLWEMAKNDLAAYLDNAEQRHRLREKGLDDIFEYTCTTDSTSVVPVLVKDKLFDIYSVVNEKVT